MNMINRKQLYTNQTQFEMEESKQNETFYCHSWFKCCIERNKSMVAYLVFCLFYSSICQLYNYPKLWFCNVIVILAIYFRLKTGFLSLVTFYCYTCGSLLFLSLAFLIYSLVLLWIFWTCTWNIQQEWSLFIQLSL